MKSLILALTLFSMTVCFSQAAELHLSNSVVMDLTLPKEASHSSNLLILKFDDWHFSHEARFQIISATFMERCRRGSQLLKVVRSSRQRNKQ
ncbi:hypothetical protein CRN62_15250, partial [Vibrio vulnificus]